MTQTSYTGTSAGGPPAVKAGGFGDGYLFGVPVRDLGWFASLLMGMATGFAAFFAATFCAIVGIMILNGVRHSPIDYAESYRMVGFPVGVLVMVLALTYLGVMWMKRMLRKA